MRLALVVALFAASLRAAAAQPASPSPPPPAPAPVHAVRLASPIVLDGRLDEPAWHEDDAVEITRQSDPRQGAPASQRTLVRVAYDDDAIYVGARLFDSRPDSIVARLSRRDNDGGADYFVVYFDTFRDHRTGYYFGVTAAGTQLDGALMNDDWDDDSWDAVWSARTQRDSLGWTAELRIPFSQLRSAGGEHMTWGVDFGRVLSRAHEVDKLVWTPRGASGFVSRFPDLVGLDGIRGAHVVEVTPYTTGKAERLVHAAGDPFHTDTRWTPAAGGDLRTNLGAKFTLNATVNPDFGQVEIDPAVVNLSDVETYYSEKRPFFTEGLSVFRCGNNGASDYWNFNWPEPTFFYTRRIGRAPQGGVPADAAFADPPLATHILGAVKLTGQPTPQWNTGLVEAVTRQEDANWSSPDGARHSTAVEPTTSYTVLRGMRSFRHDQQGLGLMVMETARRVDDTPLADELSRNAVVAAMDGWTALDREKTWVLSGYLTGSRVDGAATRIAALQGDPVHYYQRPFRGDLGVDSSATSLSGFGGRLWLNRQKGPWMSNSAIGFLTPGFETNDLGFDWRADVVNGHLGLGYLWGKPGRWRRDAWVIGALAENWDFGGQHLMNQLFLKGNLDQMNGAQWNASGGWMFAAASDRATRGGPVMATPAAWWNDTYWASNARAKLYVSIEVSPSGDERGSIDVPVSTSLTWKPSGTLSLTAGPTFEYNRADAQYVTQARDPLATATGGGRYVFARLDQRTVGATLRADWSLTTKLTLQLYVQPLVSSGRYSDYRELAAPGTYAFERYGRDGGSTLGTDANGDLVADPDGAGPAPAIDLGHPDFTFRTVRGDAVLRWEYAPGSTVYLVWTQDRQDEIGDGRFDLGPSLSQLGRTPANNIVMVKATRHFDL